MKRSGPVAAVGTGILLLLGACRTPAPQAAPPPAAHLILRPGTATVTAGHLFRFGYQLTSWSGTTLEWRVLEPEGGSIDGQGWYHAPDHPGAYTVEARPQTDPGQAVRAQVTVVAPPRGPISAPPAVAPGATDLQASVPAQPGCSYAWFIQGGALLSGQDTETVTFSAGEGETCLLRCRITNAAGDAFTSTLELELRPPSPVGQTGGQAALVLGHQLPSGLIRADGDETLTWTAAQPAPASLEVAMPAPGNQRP